MKEAQLRLRFFLWEKTNGALLQVKGHFCFSPAKSRQLKGLPVLNGAGYWRTADKNAATQINFENRR
ncbi:hypothetical protein [Planococcus glaciei]|uniref:hypothetical protein n=1 Tax=Planococcus glaciei TaxID=459472 RepID=UPI001C72CBD7|nr:hypothetical protein [Planococcus glaciei]MBX0315102.1 hypothetical protein [Planococcus glaciei]